VVQATKDLVQCVDDVFLAYFMFHIEEIWFARGSTSHRNLTFCQSGMLTNLIVLPAPLYTNSLA